MADEWWTTSARSGGGGGGGGDVSSATESEGASSRQISISSISFQLPASGFVSPDDGAAASSSYSSFLADPEMAGSTNFDALLRLQGDASHRFLLVGQGGAAPDPVVPQPASPYDADGVVASSQQGGGGVPLYADSQYGSSLSGSYGEVRAAVSTTAKPKPFSQALQQFPGFFSSPALFGTAPVSPRRLLLQALEQKPLKSNTQPAQDACSSSVPIRSGAAPDSPAAVKKPRIQTLSPLPTFKVRKEKLGDRITALQQLVSPFGKTDTASVLHEAVECIKFLHDQVASLSSPYLSCGRPVKQPQHQQCSDGGGEAKDLRSRGLCLVPVASETAATEFWHPTFEGIYKSFGGNILILAEFKKKKSCSRRRFQLRWAWHCRN